MLASDGHPELGGVETLQASLSQIYSLFVFSRIGFSRR